MVWFVGRVLSKLSPHGNIFSTLCNDFTVVEPVLRAFEYIMDRNLEYNTIAFLTYVQNSPETINKLHFDLQTNFFFNRSL